MASHVEFLEVCDSGNLERVRQLLAEGVDVELGYDEVVFDEIMF
jgi:hypothetical protein